MELELDLHWRPRQDLDLTAGYRIQRIADVTNRINVFPLTHFSDALDPVIQQDVFAELG
jgi:hypothetical protein